MMEDRGCRMEDGGWRMEDGGWRMEDGGWRMKRNLTIHLNGCRGTVVRVFCIEQPALAAVLAHTKRPQRDP